MTDHVTETKIRLIVELVAALSADFRKTVGQTFPGPYVALVKEEAEEFLEAMGAGNALEEESGDTNVPEAQAVTVIANILKEFVDFLYVFNGFLDLQEEAPEEHKVSDGTVMAVLNIADDLDSHLETVVATFPFNTIVAVVYAVHNSNLSKFDVNGNPIFNEAGKVVKGDNYKPADIEALVRGMLNDH